MVGRCLEVELLLCCARISSNSGRAEQLRTLLRKDLDWAFLVRTAHRHGVVPLLFWRLSEACPEAVPTDVLDRLRNDFHANSLRNLSLTGELLRLLNLFEAQGIPAIPYKGPALAAVAYGNVALRQFIDLDILVHKQDVLRAKEVLISAGYRPADRLTRAQEAAFLQYKHERLFRRDADGSVVELHWGITDRIRSFPLDDSEHLWGRLEWGPLGRSTIPIFSSEDLLLILCIHGSVHCWQRLGWICDVAQLINAREIDWPQVMEQAAALDGERMLFLGLYLASDLLETALPEEVFRKVEADPTVKVLAREVRERFFSSIDSPLGAFDELFFVLRMKKRLRDRIWYLVRIVTTGTVKDWRVLPLPAYLFPLYYVIRPIRLIGKYGRKLFCTFND